jgi:NAD(P)-dependent dehydrogenase (short-subunit alcohol dehydrogenase family)
MKTLVIGATGTIGTEVSAQLEAAGHDVLRASRRGSPRVDLADPDSIARLFASVGELDAVICCAAGAPLTPLLDDGFLASLMAKLLGQVEVVRRALPRMRDGGVIVLTSGQIPEATPGSAGGALVNAGLDAFVAGAAVELPRGLRLRAISPGCVRETLVALGMDPVDGIPAAEIARAYVEAV